MKLNIKIYGILVNDNDEILLKKDEVLSLPGGDIKIGNTLKDSIKDIIKEKTNINMIDVLLFDELSIIKEENHDLAIFFIGTFYKEEIEKINQDFGWYKISKLNRYKIDEYTKYIIDQIISE